MKLCVLRLVETLAGCDNVGAARLDHDSGAGKRCAEPDTDLTVGRSADSARSCPGTEPQFRSDSTVDMKPPPWAVMMAMVRFCPALNDWPGVIYSAKPCPGSVKMAW